MLSFKEVSFVIDDQQILTNINLTIAEQKITAIIGPNGSGKSSLINLLNAKQSSYEGQITYDNQPFQRYQFVSEISILQQQVTTPEHIRVYDFIKYGLIANFGMFSSLSDEQLAMVESTIQKCNLDSLRSHKLGSLSGGERQRVLIASSIVRNPKLLILDEPTTFMDLKYQVELLALIKSLHLSGMSIVVVLHDINQALNLASDVVVLKDGAILFDGQTAEITTEILSKAFNVELKYDQVLSYHP